MSVRQRPREILGAFYTLSRRFKDHHKAQNVRRVTSVHSSGVRRNLKRNKKRKMKNRKMKRKKKIKKFRTKQIAQNELYLLFSCRNRKTYLTESLHGTRRKHTRNIYYYINIYTGYIYIIARVYLAVMRMLHCLSVCSIQIQMYYCIRWSIIYQNI